MNCKFTLMITLVLSCLLFFDIMYQKHTVHDLVIGVTAECNNGRYSTAPRGQGVCSGNDGVKRWIE